MEESTQNNARTRFGVAMVLLVMTLAAGVLVTPDVVRSGLRYGAYYFGLAALAGFLIYAGVILGRSVLCFRALSTWIPVFWLALGGWLLFAHADFGFKIAMDDYVLASTAENLHRDRQLVVTRTLVSYGDTNLPGDTYVDKRPWLYPFLVSVLHDWTGFRVENSFILNAALGLGLLGTAYWLGARFAGWRGGGLSVLLWVSVPLLAQNATGGGMELLGTFLVGLVLVFSVRYLEEPSRLNEGALSMAAVLLANARYESGLFLIGVLAVIGLGWWRRRAVGLSWASVCAAPLLLTVLWQLRLYAGDSRAWELTGGNETALSASYLEDNLPHALNFFFSFDDSLANSLLLSVAGTIGCLSFLFLLRTELKRYWREKPVGVITGIFLPVFIMHLALMISFHAGRLDSPFVSRYALVTHFLLVLVVVAMMEYIGPRWRRLWPVALTIT
ncbi:MAG: hypothetical protein ACPGSB_07430, partial [Opitutales bacterium]